MVRATVSTVAVLKSCRRLDLDSIRGVTVGAILRDMVRAGGHGKGAG